MIEYSRSSRFPAPVIKLFGLGGAGCNVVDRLILDGMEGMSAVALNTDIQSLNGSVAPEKVHLGHTTTRGLGAGGDPEVGYSASEEAMDEISDAVRGAQMVFLCVGLGGGTGSGGAPLVAHLARKAGALVVAVVTLPFSFEGKRRAIQAAQALAQLEQQADLVVTFENDRIGDAVAPTAGVQQAFLGADQVLSQSVRALATVVQRRGVMNLGMDDLAAALHGKSSRALFGYGESESPNRAHEAIERALKSPLLNKGKALSEVRSTLIHIVGGPELTLNEVTTLMEEFSRHIGDETCVHFGVATDARFGKRLGVSILASESAVLAPVTRMEGVNRERENPGAVMPPAKPQVSKREIVVQETPDAGGPEIRVVASEEEQTSFELAGEPEPPETRVATAKQTGQPAGKPATRPGQPPSKSPVSATGKKEEKAEQMTLEPQNRGRFEKSEPTIVDGQDLDVPTFMRKNMKLK